MLEFRCGWVGVVSVWQAPATRIPPQPSHTKTPTHIETRKHNQCGDTIEKSQAPYDGCINVRNMLSIEDVKQNSINCDIKLVYYSSTITMMLGPIYKTLLSHYHCALRLTQDHRHNRSESLGRRGGVRLSQPSSTR